jgi:hypothetical protein
MGMSAYMGSQISAPPTGYRERRLPAAEAPLVQPQDIAEPQGLPPIGKWMIDSKGNVAHWLGVPLNNHEISEPINIIIRIHATSADEANQKLLKATSAAGFDNRKGHSDGYSAHLGDQMVSQFSPEPDHAFSDGFYLFANNHGRIFGPVFWPDYYYYSAAFSREDVDLVHKVIDKNAHMHLYASFNQARDAFAQDMAQRGGAKIMGTVPLDNALPDNPTETTGDHDGNAILLELE